jgi:chemotaxis protein methyltransferase CheR
MSVSAAVAEREFAYSKRDFDRVCRMIRTRAGIALAPGKEDMVYGRLVRRLRERGLGSFREYLDLLEHSDDGEWEAFTNALTTNLTAFFREPHHFEALAALLAQSGRSGGLRLWSAAASTGEEPYSMAMTVAEHYGRIDAPVQIIATDIDTQVLDTARSGIYTLERVANLAPARLRRFFQRGSGANQGYCRVDEGLRRMVEFRPLNLLEEHWDVHGPFDAIFCRNVMIYFDKDTQYRVLGRLMPLLTADGLFFAGHSESFFHATDLVQSCGRTIYRHAARTA